MLPSIRTILYCTQMGPNTAYVFRYAYALAKQLGAKIVVLHVIETLSPRQRALVEGYSGEGSISTLLERIGQDARERIPKRIEAFCAKEAGEDDWHEVVSEIVVAEGKVNDEILAHAASRHADLVVVGAHSESSLVENIMGSTARALVKSCPVPLLTVQVPEGKQSLTSEI